MAIKPTFAAEVLEDLTLRFINPAKLKQHLLPLKGQIVMVTAEKLRKHRTDDQNRYYRGVVLKTIADHSGYSGQEELEALHYEMRRRFLPNRGRLNIPVSTTALDTVEMTEYIENIRRWAAEELQLYIPDPNEVEP
ncbi:hypothetical protein C5Q97_19010 [Victivallales bacterium CCUG 44730]|nr:hypothetical protein C5Q97_19010 [Victivallales bacterium CCUG 44730]